MRKIIREPVKNYLADFFPLAENHFAKKSLTEIGGTSPTPLTENHSVVYFKHYENIMAQQMGGLESDCEIFLFSVKTQETCDIFDAVCIVT